MPLPSPNPYAAGAGAPPPALTGRDDLIKHCEGLLRELQAGGFENHMLISGVRGVGKTVLLNLFERIAEDAQWYWEIYEVQNTTALPSALARIFRKMLLQLSLTENAKDKAVKALRVLKAFSLTLGGAELKIDVDAALGSADSGSLADDLRDLFVEVGEAAKASGTGVLILIDEVQLIEEESFEALLVALHRVNQLKLPVAFVGAGLPTSRALSAQAKTYVERMFTQPEIGALPPEAARSALSRPAEERGIAYEAEALDRILEYSGRYPFFLQKYGRLLWATVDGSPITVDDVEKVRPLVQADLDESFFATRDTLATEAERKYMTAMALLGDGPQAVGEIAAKAGYKKSSLASPHRDALLKKNLVYQSSYGYLDFTAPLFADYLRRTYGSAFAA